MKRENLQRFMDSDRFTRGEKLYVFDCQFRMGGSFILALFEAIARADRTNRARLAIGFPDEVQGYVAFTEGDLNERIEREIGEPVM